MRYHQILAEHDQDGEWAEFLEWADLWAAEGGGNDFEHSAGYEAEPHMLRLRHVVAGYAQPDHKMLFRGTGGISRRQAAAIKRSGKTIAYDMSETELTSWTTNPEVATVFAQRAKGVVLRYPVSDFDVVVSFSRLWHAMSPAEREYYPAIGVAASEAEVLVRHNPRFIVTSNNLH